MAFTRQGTWTNPIVNEADRPKRSASAMKAVFDSNSNDLKMCIRDSFGTAAGKLCVFKTDTDLMEKYSDDGEPIEAVWTTLLDDFGAFAKRKTMIKKGCAVMIKPYTRSSVEVWAATEKEWEWKIQEDTMDIFTFADIDFGRITFNTRDVPQVIPFNKKIKKFITLQLIFRNAALNEGLSLIHIWKRPNKPFASSTTAKKRTCPSRKRRP